MWRWICCGAEAGEREGDVVGYVVVQRWVREGCGCWICCGAEAGKGRVWLLVGSAEEVDRGTAPSSS